MHQAEDKGTMHTLMHKEGVGSKWGCDKASGGQGRL